MERRSLLKDVITQIFHLGRLTLMIIINRIIRIILIMIIDNDNYKVGVYPARA